MKTFMIVACTLFVGTVLGFLFREPSIRSLQRQVRKLRSAVKSSGNPAVDGLSTHEKALYYKMLDSLENGNANLTQQNRLAKKNIIRSVTRFLFVTAQIFAIIWVSWSYVIATYSTFVLMQPSPIENLSCQAIITILGMGGLKVVENIFEHNEGPVFGKRASVDEPTTEAPYEGAEETEGKG